MMMIMMMMVLKMVLLPLLLLQALLTGVCSRTPREMHVKAGEMVALTCRHSKGYSHSDGRLRWTSYTPEQTDVTDGMLDVLVQGRSLVILKASVNHQGNYSCSLGNASRVMWFRLNVYTTNSREYERKTTYTRKCFAQESCILKCPKVNAPVEKNLNITNTNILWHKGEDSFSNYYYYYFPSVKENDSGVYTCTRSYLYRGQIYNMTMRVSLDVRPKIIKKTAAIISPKMNAVFEVELGAPAVIPCEAVLSSSFDEVYWLSGERNKTFIKTNSSLPVYYNVSRETSAEGEKMTASLVFQKVSEEDLSKQYTCKLATSQESSPVTIFLKQKTLDTKSNDAFLMNYKSDTGLNNDNMDELRSVLENTFGCSLRLCDPNISSKKDAAAALLNEMGKSRAVVLVPSASDPCLGSDLLNNIYTDLVKQQTHLVFIKPEASQALQILERAGESVTWKGEDSLLPNSPFLKQLRHHLPAPEHPLKHQLLPAADTQDTMC
ncbi:uncharacterized protein V6R79_022798 [Siganus canaliculatus]